MFVYVCACLCAISLDETRCLQILFKDQNNNNNMATKYQEIKYIYLIEQMLIWLRKLDSNIRCEQREKKILNIDKNNDGKY